MIVIGSTIAILGGLTLVVLVVFRSYLFPKNHQQQGQQGQERRQGQQPSTLPPPYSDLECVEMTNLSHPPAYSEIDLNTVNNTNIDSNTNNDDNSIGNNDNSTNMNRETSSGNAIVINNINNNENNGDTQNSEDTPEEPLNPESDSISSE